MGPILPPIDAVTVNPFVTFLVSFCSFPVSSSLRLIRTNVDTKITLVRACANKYRAREGGRKRGKVRTHFVKVWLEHGHCARNKIVQWLRRDIAIINLLDLFWIHDQQLRIIISEHRGNSTSRVIRFSHRLLPLYGIVRSNIRCVLLAPRLGGATRCVSFQRHSQRYRFAEIGIKFFGINKIRNRTNFFLLYPLDEILQFIRDYILYKILMKRKSFQILNYR